MIVTAKDHLAKLTKMTDVVKKIYIRKCDTLEFMKNALLNAAKLVKQVQVDVVIYTKMEKAVSAKAA